MTDQHVLMVTRYGRQPAFAACPSAPGQYPGIILYMDAPGFRDELCDMARRIANRGYFCLVPDLYYRLGTIRFDVARRNDPMSAVIRAAMQSLTIDAVMQDTAGMIAFLDAQEKLKPGPLGCVGHCMSGPFAVCAAARYTRMQAAAALYGVDMVTEREDSPHACLDRVRGELYLGFAEVDPAVPETVVPRFKEALAKARTKHVLETVPGTHHGYLFPARPDYNPVAAEETWEKLFDLWQRNLG
jgi:carboxymethylenebutenolidase